MKKKFMVMMLATIMIISIVLVGCGSTEETGNDQTEGEPTTESESSDESESGEKTELTYWALASRQDAVEAAAEEFNATNDNFQVRVSYYDTDGIKDAKKVAISSGTLPNMWHNWGGSLGRFYVDNDVTYDLTEYAAANGWDTKFTESSLDLVTFDDEVSGYPTSFNAIGVFYRKDIFDEYDIEIPTTLEEFEEVCATLKENEITPISTAGLNGWHVMRFVELLIEHYAGPELHDSINVFEESYDNEAVVKAFEKYKEFVDKGYFPEGFLTANPDDTHMEVFSGNAAMDIQGQWYDATVIRNEQDVSLYGAFPFPSGGTNRLSAFAEMTQFNADNSEEELDGSVQFIDLLHSEKFADEYSGSFNLPLPFQDAKMPEGHPNVPVLLEASEQNGIFTITDQALPTEVADVLFDAQEAIATDSMTPEEGAKAIAEAIEAYQNK